MNSSWFLWMNSIQKYKVEFKENFQSNFNKIYSYYSCRFLIKNEVQDRIWLDYSCSYPKNLSSWILICFILLISSWDRIQSSYLIHSEYSISIHSEIYFMWILYFDSSRYLIQLFEIESYKIYSFQLDFEFYLKNLHDFA